MFIRKQSTAVLHATRCSSRRVIGQLYATGWDHGLPYAVQAAYSRWSILIPMITIDAWENIIILNSQFSTGADFSYWSITVSVSRASYRVFSCLLLGCWLRICCGSWCWWFCSLSRSLPCPNSIGESTYVLDHYTGIKLTNFIVTFRWTRTDVCRNQFFVSHWA